MNGDRLKVKEGVEAVVGLVKEYKQALGAGALLASGRGDAA